MPFPDTLDTAQVSGQIVGYTGLPAAATFTSPDWLIGDVFVPSFTVSAVIDDEGAFTVELPWTTNSGWTPTAWTYAVRMDHGRDIFRGTLTVPENTVTMDLQDGFSPDAEVTPGQSYALVGHDHVIADVEGLQGELSLKLEEDDIAHLASDESVEERLEGKADVSHVHLPLQLLHTPRPGTTWYSTDSPFDVALTSILDTGDRFTYPLGHAQERETYEWNGSSWAGPVSTLEDIPASVDAAIVHPRSFGGYMDIATAPTTGTWAVGDIVETRIGRFRCSVAGTPGTWVPLWREQAIDKGYAAWNGDPGTAVQAGTIIPTGGLSFIFRLRALKPLFSKIQMHCSTTATGVTNAWCTLHDDNGLILNANAKSNANQNTAFNSGGMKDFTFISPQAVTPGAFYRVRVWFTTGTTLPTISRMCNSNTAIINPDITGTAASTAYGWASADSGLTDLASAPDQIGNLTGANTAWWMGAK